MSDDQPIQLRRVSYPKIEPGKTYLPAKPFLEFTPDGFRSQNYTFCHASGQYSVNSQSGAHGGGEISANLTEEEFFELSKILTDAIARIETRAEDIFRRSVQAAQTKRTRT